MDGLLWAVIGSAILSGFFALAGYSLREFRSAQLQSAFGPRRAGQLDVLARNLASLRLMTAFCRSLANLVLVVATLYLLGGPGHGFANVVWGLLTAWAILAIFGVAIPHAWAYASGEKVLAALFMPLMLLRYILYPVVAVLQAFEPPIRRLSGAADRPADAEVARQEILEAASEGRAEGSVNADEARMIEQVIGFGRRQAGEIMTPRTDIFALPVSTNWADACRQIHEGGHSRIPVYEGDLDNIVGVLYAKDLLANVAQPQATDLKKLVRKPFFVPETKRLDDLLREFKARKVHLAVVLDEYGGTAGLVSFEDVLEEIVGDISDEYDRPEPALMKRLDDKSAEVDGRMYIDDLNEAMRLRVPEDADYDTVAGLVFSELGYIPTVGEKLEAYDASFTVLAADERRITRVRVELLPQEQQAE
jgi:putative hemolysin